jgi:membrane protease YdiL (CAAX protease family)
MLQVESQGCSSLPVTFRQKEAEMNASQKTDCALVRWAPSRNSGIAIVTLLGMIAAYAILGANPDNPLVLMLIGLVAVPVLSIFFPVYWTTQVERQPISVLGLTTLRWLPSLLLSLGLSLVIILPVYLRGIASEHNWLPMAAAGALSLFEPLFIFGWLQLRFEKDFGVLPAIILAGLSFALYHAGFMPAAMQGQFYNAALWAVCFRLTSNLLVTWPILWATTSGTICYNGAACMYTWSMVVTWAIMLVIEIAFIAFMNSRERRWEAKVSHMHA